jgi:ABC-2 type transport system ATP-binding protein
MSDDRIVLENVSKQYDSVQAVDDISLQIGGGQYHCLLGPNGSGKSTILRLILGLTQTTSGTVSTPSGVVGCGFQQPNFYSDLSVRENLDIFERLVGTRDDEWRARVVESLRLERALGRRAGALSGGFARKLDLALALLKQPDLLVLDEPLGALDDVSTVRLLEFLRAYNQAGNTILVATHRVTEFEDDIDRVTVMHRGDVVFDRQRGEISLGEDKSLQEYYVELVLSRENTTSQNSS